MKFQVPEGPFHNPKQTSTLFLPKGMKLLATNEPPNSDTPQVEELSF